MKGKIIKIFTKDSVRGCKFVSSRRCLLRLEALTKNTKDFDYGDIVEIGIKTILKITPKSALLTPFYPQKSQKYDYFKNRGKRKRQFIGEAWGLKEGVIDKKWWE